MATADGYNSTIGQGHNMAGLTLALMLKAFEARLLETMIEEIAGDLLYGV